MQRSNCGGFTLVEMAMVTMVIGIMMTMGVSMLRSNMERVAGEVTHSRLLNIKAAMIHHLRQSDRLPCADGITDTVFDGREDLLSGVCVDKVGVLPFLELGLNRQDVMDGWNNFLPIMLAPQALIRQLTGPVAR